jgi:hypothetical protein
VSPTGARAPLLAALAVVALVRSTPSTEGTAAAAGAPLARISATQIARLAHDLGGEVVTRPAFGREKVARVPATEPGKAIVLPASLPWAKARFVVVDALSDGDFDGQVLFRFFAAGESEPRLSVSLGLFPGLRTRLAVPLSVLDGQTVFLPRTPGRLKCVVSGRRLPLESLARVEVQLKKTAAPQSLYLGALLLTARAPSYPVPPRPLVDGLGQWTAKDWPGKTPDDAQLGTDLAVSLEKARAADYPRGYCAYGGTTSRTFPATGFFRTENDGKRWWLVDPDGHGFYSAGLDAVRPGETSAIVPGSAPLFGPLPSRTGPLGEAWSAATPERQIATFSFGRANLIRSFGPTWRKDWTELTRGRLKAWRFTTVGNWSDPEFCRDSGLPYVLPMPDYPGTAVKLFRDFPDVFSDEFQESARRWAQALAPHQEDRALIGYFMRNEPLWAFGPNNLAAEMLEANPGTATRKELARWLSRRYAGDAAGWARAWGLGLTAFEQVVAERIPRAADRSPKAKQDLWEFSREMVRDYVRVPADECRKVDPHHLNLGMRYGWISSDLLYEAAQSFDVFTLNSYQMVPPLEQIDEITRVTGKPVLIGEFHFGALDRGLPATGLRAVASQAERGVAYRRYVEQAATDPNVVGTHYFILNDQEVLGRFDGENFQIGFLDVCGRPYRELVEAARRTHESLYEVMQGQLNPYGREAAETPRVGF